MADQNSEWVVMQGVLASNQGQTFITKNDPSEPEDRKIRGCTGEVWYRVIGYSDTLEEAQDLRMKTLYDVWGL